MKDIYVIANNKIIDDLMDTKHFYRTHEYPPFESIKCLDNEIGCIHFEGLRMHFILTNLQFKETK